MAEGRVKARSPAISSCRQGRYGLPSEAAELSGVDREAAAVPDSALTGPLGARTEAVLTSPPPSDHDLGVLTAYVAILFGPLALSGLTKSQ